MWESLTVAAVGLVLGYLAAAGTVASTTVNVRATIGVTVMSAPLALLGAVAAGATLVVCATAVVATLVVTRTPPIRAVAAATCAAPCTSMRSRPRTSDQGTTCGPTMP
ncbi:hypothetical protein Vau01_115440 [Virgisporangium aurantiacum]|uniref:Uncharacterized protein n=1 Tax=Virgisporangium aurantiacum TaxID=175570 RepID=A0A8J3ZM20_9ACTN|nr:hypothetical protein Vau01_115440 [Virgisporangium aurantiacum]